MDYENAPAEYAAGRGFGRVAQSMSDRVEVASLGCWLRAIGEGRDARLRLGIGIDGEELFLTEAEAANARAEAANARANSAEAEVARLRALLAGRG